MVNKVLSKPKLRTGKLSAILILALILLAGFAALLTIMTQKQLPPTTTTSITVALSNSTTTHTHLGMTTTTSTKPSSNAGDASFVKPLKSYEELANIVSSGLTRYYSLGGTAVYAEIVQAGIKVPALATTPLVTTVTATTTASTGGSTPEYSHTNVQVAGVDEADIVKTDGRYIYLVGRPSLIKTRLNGKEIYVQRTPIYIILAYPPNDMKLVSKVEVLGSVNGIFINNNQLVVINSSSTYYRVLKYTVTSSTPATTTVTVTTTGVPAPPIPVIKPIQNTTVLVYDVSNHEKPALKYKDSVSGWVLAARMIGDKVYVVTVIRNDFIIPLYGQEGGEPSVVVPAVNGKVMPPNKIMYVSLKDITPYNNGYVVVAGLSLSNGAFNAKAYVMPYPDRVYVSKESIYLLSSWWSYYEVMLDVIKNAVFPNLPHDVVVRINVTLSNMSLPIYVRLAKAGNVLEEYMRNAPKENLIKIFTSMYEYLEKNITGRPLTVTHIFRLKLEGLTAAMVAHAKVSGRVLDQFAMDERDGYFRAATTATVIKEFRIVGYSENMFPTLRPVYEDINNVYVLNASSLKIVGKLEGVEPGERVYAARYVGKYLYLVTFRRTDPLFAIDLSDPRNPKVIGFVKMPGFSEYLHPYKDHYLIGVGLDADESGRVKGLKISLYDVSNPQNITETSVIKIRGGWSTSRVLWDHKAFLINPDKGYLCIPVRVYGEGKVSGYLYIVRISDDGKLSVAGKIQHLDVIRSLYIGDYLYATSQTLVQSVDLNTMKVISSIELS